VNQADLVKRAVDDHLMCTGHAADPDARDGNVATKLAGSQFGEGRGRSRGTILLGGVMCLGDVHIVIPEPLHGAHSRLDDDAEHRNANGKVRRPEQRPAGTHHLGGNLIELLVPISELDRDLRVTETDDVDSLPVPVLR
jgi:hypothetical protein